MSRIENTSKNFMVSTMGTVVSAGLGFISRTVFINILGADYLGINGLFVNLLSMLSVAELGIGSAINFSLYAPLADNDTKKIKSLMKFYKKAYQIISLLVATIGIAIIPFLKYLIKGSENIDNILIIYLIFLFNTAYSYLFSYKRTLLSADQKSYILTKINMIISIVTLIIQLVILLIFRNYILYLISALIVGILQNIYVNAFIDKRYPFLYSKDVAKLTSKEKAPIVTNIKAMFFHKIGNLSINQTDNLIISAFINITTVGIFSNYALIINTINVFVLNVFNAASASWGNLIVKGTKEKKIEVFRGYNFLAFWFYGWTSICLYILLNPFVNLWIGNENLLGKGSLILILINYYLTGMRVPLENVKSAAGVYKQDRFVPLIQAAINLIVSIISVRYFGLAGVFLGTVVSSLALPSWYKPIIVYKHIFELSSKEYFINFFNYIIIILSNIVILSIFSNYIFNMGITWITLTLVLILCVLLPNCIFWLIFKNSADFKYVSKIVGTVMKRRKNNV